MRHTIKHRMKRVLLGTALSALGFFSLTAHAVFPDKPVTIVVPYGVGGSSDAQARVVAQALSKKSAGGD